MPNWDLRCTKCGDEGSSLDFPHLRRYPQHDLGTCKPCGAPVEIIPGYYGHEDGKICDELFPCEVCGNPDDAYASGYDD